MYAVEIFRIIKKQEESLKILKNKIMKTILGPTEYRSRSNNDLLQEIDNNIINRIKQKSSMIEAHKRIRCWGKIRAEDVKDCKVHGCRKQNRIFRGFGSESITGEKGWKTENYGE